MQPIDEMTAAEVKVAIVRIQKKPQDELTALESNYLQTLKDVDLHGFDVGLRMARNRAVDVARARKVLPTPDQVSSAKLAAVAMLPQVQQCIADRDMAIGQLAFQKATTSAQIAALELEVSGLRKMNIHLDLELNRVNLQGEQLVVENKSLLAEIQRLIAAEPRGFVAKFKRLFQP